METKNNSGVAFKNDKKTNEKAPDYKGTVNVNGKDMEIAMWVKESQKGTKYFSVAFQEPFKKDTADATFVAKNNKQDDDLPF